MGLSPRAFVLHVAFPLVACGQLWAAIELAGLTLPAPPLVLGLEGLAIVWSVLRARRAAAPPPEVARSWAGGLACFAVWAVLYFAAGSLVDPGQAATFSDPVLARAPLVPAWTGVYLGVHPFGIVPFCVLLDADRVRRHLRGAIAIVVVSSVVWVTWPVRLDHPTVPDEARGFGAFLLRALHGLDPATNCFPSAHCAIAVYAAIGLAFARSRALFAWGAATATAVCASTIFTRQHYVADVVAGALLAVVTAAVVHRRRRHFCAAGGSGNGSGSGIGTASPE